MFIEEDKFTTRVSSLDNLINRLDGNRVDYRRVGKGNGAGRPKGRRNDSLQERLAIAEDAILHGPTEAAEIHDTTISRASLLSSGVVTHSKGSDEKLAPVVVSKKEKINQKALDLIQCALDNLEPQLDEVTKPTDLVGIAESLSKIAERTATKNPQEENKPQVQVVVFAPRMKEMDEFETIDVN